MKRTHFFLIIFLVGKRSLESQSLLSIVGMLTLTCNVGWSQNGVTVAGGNGYDDSTNQLNIPHGFDINDDNPSVVIADKGGIIASSNER